MTPNSFPWKYLVACLALAAASNGKSQSSPNLGEPAKSVAYWARPGGILALPGQPLRAWPAVPLVQYTSSLGSNTVLSLTTLAPLPGRTLSGLVEAGDGNFYGTTEYGGTLNQGTVFQLTAGGALTPLYSFTGGNDGANPLAGLAVAPDGSLYGTTSSGADTSQDPSGAGTVFRITTNGTFSTVYAFTGGNDGDTPSAALAPGPDGNFYGTTAYGGTDGYGCIFNITPGGAETAIYSFTLSLVGNSFALTDGSSPVSALVLGTNGSFYGTTQSGGANGVGTVFDVTLGGTLTTFDSFSAANGGNGAALPGPQLAPGTDGNLYGTTYSGGASSKGTIFKVAPDGTLTTLYSFTGGPDGGNPVGGLVQGSDGYFYGTTSAGGTSIAQDPAGLGYGTVFQASPAGAVTNLYSFTGAADGSSPGGTLVQGSDGAFYGTTTTTAFQLSVITLPYILTQPVNQTSAPGGSASFNIVAGGSAPLVYQWQLDGTNLDGAASSSLVFTNVQLAQAGYYTAIAANSGGSVTSSVALLTVTAPPAITSQPESQTVGRGLPASFTVTAIGTPPLHYQWRFNGTNVSGGTGSSLVLTNVQLAQAGNYVVVVSGVGGSVTSSNAVLTVDNVAPAITKQPVSQTAGVAQTATFTVVATGSPTLSYQWFFDGTNIPGATATNLILSNLDASQTGLYSVMASNSYGTATSSNAALMVILAPLFVTQPQGRTNTGLTNVTFNPRVAGAEPLNYQWLFNGIAIAGATNVTLTLSNAAAVQSGDYVLTVNNAYGNATSSPPALLLVEQSYTVTTMANRAGLFGSTNGLGASARFSTPYGVALDSAGNIYVADTGNSMIRKITPNGLVTTVAGKAGQSGNTNGSTTNARFSDPQALVVDSSGNIYVADTGDQTIRKITPAGLVSTFAGIPNFTGSTDGASNVARFFLPGGIALDSSNNVYVADSQNNTIRKITPAGVVSTIAGTPRASGNIDGFSNKALFNFPQGIALDASNNLYVADTVNSSIRKITPSGIVSTFAGSKTGLVGAVDGFTNNARFFQPAALTIDKSGNLYVADSGNQQIRMITPAGLVTTLAGAVNGFGSTDGAGALARFNGPRGIAVDGTGDIYVADTGSATIRKGFPLGTTAPPSFPSPLQSQTATAGSTFVFTPNLAGSMPMMFQWQFGGVNIAGALGSSLTLSNISPAQAGQYRLIVTNYFGSATSTNALLAVVPAVAGEIINPARAQQTFSMSISSQSGKSYTLEYTDSLSNPVWIQITTVPGNGSIITLTDLGAAFPTRFYRVLIH